MNMPANDTYHDAVKRALEKDGWTITDDPFHIKVDDIDLYIDIAAEKLLAAERDGNRIAVEIKCFLNPSTITDYHTALGQFITYRDALAIKHSDRILYLAVPTDTFDTFFVSPFIQQSVRIHALKLIVFKPSSEEIIQWIN